MSTVTGGRAAVVRARSTPARARGVRPALAGAECRHLLRHPAFLAGGAGTFIILALSSLLGGIDFSALPLSGLACLPLAVGTFVAANFAAHRDRRSGTEELLAALPETATSRRVAQLLAVGASVAVAMAAVTATVLVVGALGGPHVRFDTGVEQRVPSLSELFQGPLAVAVLGLAGVAVGRVVPTPLLAPVLAAVPLFSMWPEGRLRWFAPVANPAVTVPGGYWPHPEIAPRTELIGFDVVSMGWHLLYLAGLGGLAATLAIATRRVTPGTAIAATTALAAAAAGGLLQIQ